MNMNTKPTPAMGEHWQQHDNLRNVGVVINDKGNPVQRGEVVTSFRGETYILTGWDYPHKCSSSGRIYVDDENDNTHSFFPGVCGLQICNPE